MTSSITSKVTDGVFHYVLTGYIDELTTFPALPTNGAQIEFNLKDVKGMNSVGTRAWCAWIAKAPNSLFVMHDCPAIMGRAFNMILGTMPAKMRIESIVVPYYSESTQKHQDVVFKRGVHFMDDGRINPPQINGDDGKPMEMDVAPNFFKFVRA